jgi:hypothetical protein
MKKSMPLLVVGAFVVYWLYQSPDQLASFTKDAGGAVWSATSSLFDHLISFLNQLFK